MEIKQRIKLIFTILFGVILFQDGIIAQSNNPILMAKARHEFLKGNYWGALDEYRKLYEENKDNPKLIFRMGQCHSQLKNYKIALSFFEEAETLDNEVDKELYYYLGKTYHSLEKLDLAIDNYKAFKKKISDGQEEYYEVNKRIKQCEYARELMQNPLNVEITNLGTGINSRFDDYAPSISADGDYLVFTSRRATMLKGDVDYKGDFKYFEDIYFSLRNDDGSWETSESISETINTSGHDAVLSLTPDGKGIFIYKNNEKSAGDIFYSEREGQFEWTEPIKLEKPINTSYFESSVSITEDGNTMYFISERPKGFGRGDIYVSRKISDDKWGKPQNIGAPINTKGDEKFVFIHPKGNVLFFSSEGHKTMGSYDIFRCVREGDKWGKPVNLGYPINTVNEESTLSMTKDNKKLLISAEYDGGVGERDIYEIDLSNIDIMEELNFASIDFNESSLTRVYGKLIGANDLVLANQNIKVTDNKTGDLVYETVSGDTGEFEFKLQQGQSYYLSVDVKGYEKYQKRLSLKSDMDNLTELEKDIKLREKK